MGRFSEVIEVEIEKLRPHPSNRELFNPPSQEEFEKLKKSLREVGLIDPIVINEEGVILSGHWRVEAAKELGMKKLKARIFYPDFPEEEIRVLIDSNIVRRTLTHTAIEKESEILRHCRRSEDVRKDLIEELVCLYDEGKLSHELASYLSTIPREEQLSFYKKLEEYFLATGMSRATSSDVEFFEKEAEENPQLREALTKIEELQNELIEKRALADKLKKEYLKAEELYKSAYEAKRELEEKIEELEEQLETAKEEGKKEAEREIEERIEEMRRKLEEEEKKRFEAEKEAASLRDKLKEKTDRIRALEKMQKEYEKKLKEVWEEAKKKAQEALQKALKEEREKLRRREEELRKREKEIISGAFREKVLRHYTGQGDQTEEWRAAFIWLQSAKFHLKNIPAFFAEMETRIRTCFSFHPEGKIPGELELLREELRKYVEEVKDSAELLEDTLLHPEPGVISKIRELSEKMNVKNFLGDEDEDY